MNLKQLRCKFSFAVYSGGNNFSFYDKNVPRAKVTSAWRLKKKNNRFLTAKLLRQGYRYHNIRKAFSKFYREHFDIVSK